MAVSAALAQGKWTWFQKRADTLSTFEAIDAGSRGTVGSLKLLLRMRGQHLVSAGALVITLGFMIQPFLQSAISEHGRLIKMDTSNTNGTSAVIGRSRKLDTGTQCVQSIEANYPKIDTTPDFAISASLYDGLNAALGRGYPNVSFTCISGNCTWPEYVSIAVRSTCFDISDHLERASSSAVNDSMDSSKPETGVVMYPTAPPSASSDVRDQPSTYVVPSSIPEGYAMPSSIAETSVALTASEDVSALSAFGHIPTGNSKVAPIRSTATRATAGLDKRASSGVQTPSVSPSQSPAMWTDWTLGHLRLTLSNTNPGLRESNTFAVLQAAVVADPNCTINFQNSQTLLAAFTIIRTNNTHTLGSADWDAADASAMECGLELALNVYNSSVVNNVLLEQVVASVSRKVPKSWLPSRVDQSGVLPNGSVGDPGTLESNPIYHDIFMYRDDYALDPSPLQMKNASNFTMTQKTLLSTVDFLTSLIRQDNDNGTVKAVPQANKSILYTYGSAILQPLLNQTNTTAAFDAIAKSMSNAVRNIGTEPMRGTTKQWVRFYRVRWAFLALPLSLITIGTVFCILTIAHTHKVHVPNWKANSIATMIHGPDEALRHHLRTQNHIYSLAVASETVAKLKSVTPGGPEGFALTAADQPMTRISRPTTPMRDEEEHEMDVLKVAAKSQTRDSAVTLVDPQSFRGAAAGNVRPVSPVSAGPGWSDVPIDDASTPLEIRTST